MREIKFRAWQSSEKRMWFNVQNAYDTLGKHCCENKDCDCESKSSNDLYPSSFGELLEDKDYTVMQFTGLTDKNGKDIYEGDIVRLKSEENDCELTSQVKFKSTCFMVDCDGLTFGDYSATSLGFLAEDEIEIEVIGNIYENPELLGAK